MKNYYQCKCGHGSWTILDGEIVCCACETRYKSKHMESPSDFNEAVEKDLELEWENMRNEL